MARKKLSEFRAKTILYGALGQTYGGVMLDLATATWQGQLAELSSSKKYVVKVDQAVKGRFKKGLVKLERAKAQLADDTQALEKAGFRYILVEEYYEHAAGSERYLSVQRGRGALGVSYSNHGGIDIEAHRASVQSVQLSSPETARQVADALAVEPAVLAKVIKAFDDNYFSSLEINPLVADAGGFRMLDAAVEVDEEADFFVGGSWTAEDIRSYRHTPRTPEEQAVAELNDTSQASLSLEVINGGGRIFLLLSGGGASVVLADEVYNSGLGGQLANYGEYSGNPNLDETYKYTKQILSLLLKSEAADKVLIIGGGVANFTDIRTTFSGIIKALEEVESQLKRQKVGVYVRRGGPYEAEGLQLMESYLRQAGLYGRVSGPDLMLTDIIGAATKEMAAR